MKYYIKFINSHIGILSSWYILQYIKVIIKILQIYVGFSSQ